MSTINKSLQVTDKQAVVIPELDLTFSYRQLSSLIGNFQTLFSTPQLNANKKQLTIATSLPNGLEYLVAFLGTTTAGHIIAPLNSNYKKAEFEFYLGDLQADAVIVPKGIKPESEIVKAIKTLGKILVVEIYVAKESIQFDVFNATGKVYSSLSKPPFINKANTFVGNAKAEDVALILHTSGTTSRPKQVPLSHINLTTSFKNIANTYNLTSNDVSYVVMPLFHVHGLIGSLLSTLATQGTVIIPQKFSATRFWNDFTKYKATWYSAVPTIHQIMLKVPKPAQMPKIRFIRSCSSALAPATLHKLEDHFQTKVLEAYAMTEAAHQMTSNTFDKQKPGTVGCGQGVEIVILDDENNILPQGEIGEVSIKGANVTKGYVNNAKANKENFTSNGYFRTGDQGKFDEEGFLVLTGRLKELINRGGEKISPIELDGIMLHHPNVDEVVFFGADDEKYGQAVHAAIVLKKGTQLNEKDVKEYMKDKVAPFKIPSKVFIVDSLPKTATGKIQRRKIAEFFAPKSKL